MRDKIESANPDDDRINTGDPVVLAERYCYDRPSHLLYRWYRPAKLARNDGYSDEAADEELRTKMRTYRLVG